MISFRMLAAERLETIQERSIAARRHGRGQVRVRSTFGAAGKVRRLNDNDRRAVEAAMRLEGRI
jgi:hypothetical protein